MPDPDPAKMPYEYSFYGRGDKSTSHAAVASNGHANFAIGKVPQQHGWKWGPYPEGSKNWLGIDQWEYMDLPNGSASTRPWNCPTGSAIPAYGAYPGPHRRRFRLHALARDDPRHGLHETGVCRQLVEQRPRPVGPLYVLVPRIRLHQSLPAFTNCSLDHSIGDGDHDDAQKGGGINLYQLWEPETIVDERTAGKSRWSCEGLSRRLTHDGSDPSLNAAF